MGQIAPTKPAPQILEVLDKILMRSVLLFVIFYNFIFCFLNNIRSKPIPYGTKQFGRPLKAPPANPRT